MAPAINHWKAKGVDLSRLLYQEPPKPGVAIYNCERQNHGLDKALDNELIAASEPALERRDPVRIEMPIRNVLRPPNPTAPHRTLFCNGCRPYSSMRSDAGRNLAPSFASRWLGSD